MTTSIPVWALADANVGTAQQCLGVADALGMPYDVKELAYVSSARLPNVALGASLSGLTGTARAGFTAPWPRLLIAAGRRTAPVARFIKRAAGGTVFLVQIMHPGRAGIDEFDLVAAPRHDRIAERSNVMRVTGAPHRVTPGRLHEAGLAWAPRFAFLPKPWFAVVVGGATRRRAFSAAMARELTRLAQKAASAAGGSLLVTTSRRTGEAASALKSALEIAGGPPHYFHDWRSGGENPYLGMLALANAVVVTGDSVSMCSEACATGRATYIYAPPSFATPKHSRLHDELFERGYARRFAGRFETWRHSPLNAAVEIAEAVRARLEVAA